MDNSNHDATWYKIAGIEVGKEIAKQREDMIYLGQDTADIKLNKTSIRLFHGTGAGSYARSYRAQKYLDNLQPKPDIIGLGHVHYAFYMQYLGTHVLQTASLQSASPYIKAKGLPNDMSVWFVDVDLDSRGKIFGIRPELMSFGDKGAKVLKKSF